MSLTQLLKSSDHLELKDQLRTVFHKPDFLIPTPILATPLTKNYGLVGQAFDYLVRFYLEHHYSKKILGDRSWVAQNGYYRIIDVIEDNNSQSLSIGFKREKSVDKSEFQALITNSWNTLQDNTLRFSKKAK